jgi:hypothetical protein
MSGGAPCVRIQDNSNGINVALLARFNNLASTATAAT